MALLVRGELAAQLDGVRRACGDPAVDQVAPHVTVIPPINVAEGDLPAAGELLERVAVQQPAALEVLLGPAATFQPASPVCYFAVTGDDAPLIEQLHRSLRTGPLERPDVWPFVPHLTIAVDVDAPRAAAICQALDRWQVPVRFGAVHLLEERRAEGRPVRWEPIAEAAFGAPVVVGRGGIEVELRVLSVAPPAWTDDDWVIVARVGGIDVGVARGRSHRLDELVVDEAHRGLGIGGRLLRAVEDHMRSRGGERATASGALAPWLLGRGWQPTELADVARVLPP